MGTVTPSALVVLNALCEEVSPEVLEVKLSGLSWVVIQKLPPTKANKITWVEVMMSTDCRDIIRFILRRHVKKVVG